MTSDQTHPTTPISDSDLRLAREAAAQHSESEGLPRSWARAYRSGEWDSHPEIVVATRALVLALSRASNPPPDTAVAGEAERLLAIATDALGFYANKKNWIDTPPWDGDPEVLTPKAIPVGSDDDGARPCDCGDRARSALALLAAAPPVPNCLRADADAELEELSAKATQGEWVAKETCWFRNSIMAGKEYVVRANNYSANERYGVTKGADSAFIVALVNAYRSARLAPASSGQGDADGWRSMDSAPKDGTSVLIAEGGIVCEARFIKPACEWWPVNNDPTDSWGAAANPFAWRPMPAAPVEPGR